MLNQYKTIVINLEEQKDRFENCKKILNSINQPFERFNAIKHEQGIVGCGLSHLELFNKITPGTLVFEDDIELTSFEKRFEQIPENTDAIYLGVSRYGYVKGYPYSFPNSVLTSQFNKDYKRIYNMCSLHAVIYLSKKYIDACRDITVKCLSNGIPFDLGVASIHKNFQILTPNDPHFFQSGQPHATNLSLEV